MQVKKVGIIRKKGSEQPKQICEQLESFFFSRNIACQRDRVTDDCDMLVILGGDGTLLHVADQASRLEIPVVGVNLGGLGFLTEVSVEELSESLIMLLDGEAVIEERMMLQARMHRAEGVSPWNVALNDVVISKGPVDRLIRLASWVDNEFITTYRADGLIFSSPTGSTAYSLSAGGPIVHPSLRSISVTPICPFMLESRPVLFPATVTVSTRLSEGGTAVQVIVDGRQAWEMQDDNVLEVQAAEKPLLLIGSLKKGYFEILRNKLNWGGGRDVGHLKTGDAVAERQGKE